MIDANAIREIVSDSPEAKMIARDYFEATSKLTKETYRLIAEEIIPAVMDEGGVIKIFLTPKGSEKLGVSKNSLLNIHHGSCRWYMFNLHESKISVDISINGVGGVRELQLEDFNIVGLETDQGDIDLIYYITSLILNPAPSLKKNKETNEPKVLNPTPVDGESSNVVQVDFNKKK